MNSYLIASIIQYALMLLTYLLLPFYIKNSGQFIMGKFPKKFRPIYYTGIIGHTCISRLSDLLLRGQRNL